MTPRSIFKSLATAVTFAALCASVPASAGAAALDDCRSKAEIPNAARLQACTSVIDGKQASPADTAYAYYKRAMLNASNPQADQAQVLADVSKAIELDPKLMEALAFRALAYHRAMQYDKAIADLTSAIALAPDRWGLYSLRAMVEAQAKDGKAAIADFQAALDHNPPATSAEMIRQRIAKLQQAPAN